MSLGRRKVGIDESSRWVFNRLADVYDARPPYPVPLIDALADLAGDAAGVGRTARVVDLGAGTGHVAIPLARRGLDVVAVEPALLMLERLQASASAAGAPVRTCHAAAEKLPLDAGSTDLAVVSDALHFLDAQLVSQELSRILTSRGGLAVITCQMGDTPFMRQVTRIIEEAVPRRPRLLAKQLVHVSSMTGVALDQERTFHDQTPVGAATLDRILRSISFIGPAMNAARLAAFRARVRGLAEPPVWARTFLLRCGLRRGAASRGPSRQVMLG